MTATAIPARRPVLADAVVPRTLTADILLVLGGALVVAALAQAEIPLPVVPITGQTLAVLLVGAALGAKRGALALATYAAAGLAGAPVFAGFAGGPASVLSPSFGYIIGFIPAAALTGWMAERAWDRRPLQAFAGFLGASALPFIFGVPYMAIIVNAVMGDQMGLSAALASGLWPFIPGGIVKALIAAGLIPLAWKAVRRIDAAGKR